MKKADLYLEGARLPEHLSRLLFVEGMIRGRRILEVGTRSPAVARFLLELGASRVVCAVDDRDLLERLRSENELERVDYRAVRPAGGSRPPGLATAPVLPGDDGAFDFVIDFTLAEALAAGHAERLTDIKRLLSDDGFAMTALPATARGLGGLLPSGNESQRVGYRPLVEALQSTFELVQVYFQSLLLGYLFGSFDHDPSGDGIAPQTHLMGDEPEPAGAYVFAFGNAVPVIDDVCLVQVPFDALLGAVEARRAHPSEARPETGLPVSGGSAEAFGDTTESGLDRDVVARLADRAHDADLAERDARIASLELALREARRHDPNATVIPGLFVDRKPIEDADDGENVTQLGRRLDDAAAHALGLEERLRIREAELARAGAARDELRLERDALAEQVVALDGARTSLARQARELEGEVVLARLRVDELEDLCISLDAQRATATTDLLEARTVIEGERLRANAEREMLEAAIAENGALIADLEAALAGAGVDLAALRAEDDFGARAGNARRQDDTSTVASRLRASIEQRFAAVEVRATAAEQLVSGLRDRLGRVEAERDAARVSLAEAVAEAERLFTTQLEERGRGLSADARARAEALSDDLQALRERLDARTDEAGRLAGAVQALTGERATWRRRVEVAIQQRDAAAARATATESRVDGLTAELATLQVARNEQRTAFDAELASVQARCDALAEERRRFDERRRADQRLLDDVREKLDVAQRESADLQGQRAVLQGALAARERELSALTADSESLRAAVEQQQGRADALTRREAELRDAAEALSLEVRRLHGVVDESGQRLARLQSERDALARDLAATSDDHVAALAEVDRARGQAQRLEDSVVDERAARAEAEARLRQSLDDVSRRAAEAETALARTLEAARSAADAAAARERSLEADHARTRDELAEITNALLGLEAQVVEERGLIAGRAEAAGRALEAARNRIAAHEVALAELGAELDAVRAARNATLARTGALEQDLDAARAETEAAIASGDARALALALSHRDSVSALERAFEIERDTGRAAVDGLKDDLARATGAVAAHEATIASLSAERTELEAALQSARDDASDWRGQHTTALAALAEAASGLDLATAAMASLRSTHEALLADHDATRAGLASASGALAALQAQHDTVVAALDEARLAHEALRGEHADALARLDDSARTLVAEREARAELAALLDEADALLKAATGESASLGAARDEATALVTRLGVDLADVTAARDDAVAAREEALAVAAELRDERAAIAADRTAAHDDVERLTTELHELKEALAAQQAAHGEALAETATARKGLEDLDAERDLLRAALGEARGLLEVERARGDLFSEELRETAEAAACEHARAGLFAAHLEEARAEAERVRQAFLRGVGHHTETVDELTAAVTQLSAEADAEHGRAELLTALLDEARAAGTRHLARADGLSAVVDELQARATLERTRGDTFAALLDEAQATLARERARGDAFGAHLEEMEAAARDARTRGDGLSALLEEVRRDFAALATREAGTHEVLAERDHRLATLEATMQEAVARERAAALTLRGELGEARALAGSLGSELLGLRDALATSREDASEALETAEHQLQALAEQQALLVSERDGAVAEAVALRAALAAAEAATSAADAAAQATTRAPSPTEQAAEATRRAILEGELATLRAELEDARARAAPGDTDAWRERLDQAERQLRVKDEKIGELTERVDRLTERIIRTEGLR